MKLADKPLKIEGPCGKRIIDSLYKSGNQYYFLDVGWVGTSTHPVHCIGRLVDVNGDLFTFTDDEDQDFWISPITDKDEEWGMPMLDYFYKWKKYLAEMYPDENPKKYIKNDLQLKTLKTINNIKWRQDDARKEKKT